MQKTPQSMHNLSVIWRGNVYSVEISSDSTVKQLGQELQKLMQVKEDTMRLIIPQSSDRSSKMLSPFSDEHGFVNLQEASIFLGKPIRMMGVPRHEVEEVLQNAKKDLRIAGFNEEENRLRQRSSNKPQASIILPKGPYIFCEFRTLQLPGVELNPPASEALKRMHMLASDPGIVAIMNKHRWRVGIMTEMAPVGYVGVSPKCILGLNKNHGEEISLRLRTDDLRGFRKYESIKKTLLHELAHMVFSEHDANFYALDKQLNEEAASLDWTRSRGHTLASVKNSQDYEEEFENLEGENLSRKLGGCTSNQLGSARATSVAAAYNRLANALTVNSEPDPDEGGSSEREELDHEPDSDSDNKNKSEPDPYESQGIGTFESGLGENNGRLNKADSPHQIMVCDEPDPDACEEKEVMKVEPDPDAYQEKEVMKVEPDPDAPRGNEVMRIEPDPDESREKEVMRVEPDHDESREKEVMRVEPDPDESQEKEVMRVEPDPDESLVINQVESSEMQIDEPDPDDSEIRRIQDSVTVVCSRLQKAIEMLQSEIDDPTAASTVLQTIFKIIRNVIEHPEEIKYRRLRKANPVIQRNIAKYKAAMEILVVIGFMEDVVSNEIGMAETYIVLKRNDPGLLWLAKSSLESCLAC